MKEKATTWSGRATGKIIGWRRRLSLCFPSWPPVLVMDQRGSDLQARPPRRLVPVPLVRPAGQIPARVVLSPARLPAPQLSKASKSRGLAGWNRRLPGLRAALERRPWLVARPGWGLARPPGAAGSGRAPSVPPCSVLPAALGGGCSADSLAVRALPRSEGRRAALGSWGAVGGGRTGAHCRVSLCRLNLCTSLQTHTRSRPGGSQRWRRWGGHRAGLPATAAPQRARPSRFRDVPILSVSLLLLLTDLFSVSLKSTHRQGWGDAEGRRTGKAANHVRRASGTTFFSDSFH